MAIGNNESRHTHTVHIHTDGKNTILAYVLWFFLGSLGVHRFYLGRIGSGVFQLFLLFAGMFTFGLTVVVLGIWWLVDALLIPGIVAEENRRIGHTGGLVVGQGGVSPSKDDDELSQLERLHDLKEKGVLSESEYAERKAAILKKK